MTTEGYLKLQAEQARLYEQLEKLELSGNTAAAQKVMQQIAAVETAMSKLDSAEATQPVEQQIPAATVPVIDEQTKENEMAAAITLESIGVEKDAPVTKAQIGVAEFVRPFAGQVMVRNDKGELYFNGYPVAFPVEDSDILLLQAPTSKLSKEFRVHLEQREDVKRAARGLALFLGGAIQADGTVLNGAGASYQVIDGQCFKMTEFTQTNYDGSKTKVRQPETCKGLIDSKTGVATMRCKHQWALEFASGTFVTCSRKFFELVVAAEMANIIGDEAAQEFAKQTFETWREKGETRQAARVAVAQAINDQRNRGAVDPNTGLLPAYTTVGDLVVDGKTVRDLVLEAKGRMFRLSVTVPVKELHGEEIKPTVMTTRACRNLQELASVVAPLAAAAKMNGGDIAATKFIVA